MIKRSSLNLYKRAIDKSIFKGYYKWKLGSAEVDPQTKQKSLYYYRRLLLESTENLDSPIDRQRIVDEIRWLFEQKREEDSKEEIAVLHAACEEGSYCLPVLSRIRKGEFPPFPRINKRKGMFEIGNKEENYFSINKLSILNDISLKKLKKDHAKRLKMDEAERELDDFNATDRKQTN